jgi:CheY-like chemotaxis protein
VLLVDASRDEREMYAESLRLEGFTTLQATSASDAFRLASELAPQVVVTGVKLEGQADGLALARQIKASAATRHVPVVVLSGYGSSQCREAAAQAGCDLFLVKPCLPDDLVNSITRFVPAHAHAAGWR